MEEQERKKSVISEYYKSQIAYISSLIKIIYHNESTLDSILANFSEIFSDEDLQEFDQIKGQVQDLKSKLEGLRISASIENVRDTSERINEFGPIISKIRRFINGKISRVEGTS